MDIKSLDAANAYANTLNNQNKISGSDTIGSIGSLGSIDGTDNEKSSFSSVLSDAIGGTSSAISLSEGAGIRALNNNADLVDVVTTVQNAEMVLETVVAVRDKVISAYNDIIKMPI
jgi:flagellar hook-basal body complex protein FliE